MLSYEIMHAAAVKYVPSDEDHLDMIYDGVPEARKMAPELPLFLDILMSFDREWLGIYLGEKNGEDYGLTEEERARVEETGDEYEATLNRIREFKKSM